jgi:Glycosyltransferase family 87
MEAVADHALFVLATAALGAGAFRLVSPALPDGLARLLATAAVAVTAAVAQALVLGRIGLAGSPPALAAAALLTWAAARRWLPDPRTGAGEELGRWWGATPAAGRLGMGAVGGLLVALGAWALRYPGLGVDSYHLDLATAWVRRGSTGSIEPIWAGLSIASYPVTGEAAIAWGVGLAHGFAPVACWNVGSLALTIAGGWLGLRQVGVRGWPIPLAIAAFCATPIALLQLNGFNNDLPATAWLIAAAALAGECRRRPAALPFVLLCCGLAVGTKTFTLPLALVVLALAARAARPSLRALARPLGLVAVAILVTDGVWYLRDLIDHGSPLWPLLSTPWGDPVPRVVHNLSHSFVERPERTLRGQLPIYRAFLAGGLILGGAGALAPLWARGRREVLALSAAAVVSFLIWTASPFTGAGDTRRLAVLAIPSVRYLLPALAAAAAALAASARGPRLARALGGGALLAAFGWSLKKDLVDLPITFSPPAWMVVAGALGGAAAVAVSGRVRLRVAPRWAAAAVLVALVPVLTWTGARYVSRHTHTRASDARVLGWLIRQPEWRHGHLPVAVSPIAVFLFGGPRLEHRVDLIGPTESCARIARRMREGWVIVAQAQNNGLFGRLAAQNCLVHTRPRFRLGQWAAYRA